MTSATPRTGKNCPCCLLIAPADAPHCTHCGHAFSTGLGDTDALTGAELHRTRMFTLPLYQPLPHADGGTSVAEEQFGVLAEAFRRRRHAGRAAVAAVLSALLAVGASLAWWCVRHP